MARPCHRNRLSGSSAIYLRAPEPRAQQQTLLNIRSDVLRSLATIPTAMTLCALLARSDTTYTFLLISIPCLVILLISPTPPSISFLAPSLLPTSTRLFDTLGHTLQGWTLIWPLILVFCVIFSWSMNGDIYRGFFVFSNDTGPMDIPREPGVAPFEARLTLFVTLIILSIMAIIVSCQSSVIEQVEHHPRDQIRASAYHNQGIRTKRHARQHWIVGIRGLTGDLETGPRSGDQEGGIRLGAGIRMMRPSIPPPLNLLILPFDVVCLIIILGRRLTRHRLRRHGRHGDSIYQLRFQLAVFIVGPLCFPLAVWEQIMVAVRTRTRR